MICSASRESTTFRNKLIEGSNCDAARPCHPHTITKSLRNPRQYQYNTMDDNDLTTHPTPTYTHQRLWPNPSDIANDLPPDNAPHPLDKDSVSITLSNTLTISKLSILTSVCFAVNINFMKNNYGRFLESTERTSIVRCCESDL